ncbi:sigma-70 family RNA polymerase sigma factor [Nonomuraea sp. NPDC001023]|uniref:RNA polymerase sigma factor n=1 Tax=unclassified Nonomuraea TaxID=2593643 RepID=UPI0033222C3D
MDTSDEEALGECYRTHAASVRAYLRRFVPAQEVEDLLQVVFADVWRSRGRYDPGRSQAAWVFAIAHRRAVDHLRVRRLLTVPLQEAGDLPGRARPAPDALGDRDQIDRALAELSDAQRQAIELAYFADLTQREIADHLRVPIGTVKARISRGLHRLSDLLAGTA